MRNKIFQRTIVIVKYFSVLFSLINGDVSQVHRQIHVYWNTMYMQNACNFHRVTSYHISNAILILRINEECASGYMRDKVFFQKDDLTPVKCKSFLFSECKYETGFVLLYIENFRNRHSLLLHWRSAIPEYTRDKLTP